MTAGQDWSELAHTPEVRWLDEPWADLPSPRWLLREWSQVLVLAAHPDDETLGAGGLMAAAAEAGLVVDVLVASAGEASHPEWRTVSPERLARIRLAELARATAALGVTSTDCLTLPDGELAGHHDSLRRAVEARVAAGEETLVLAPWTGDGHPDHEAVGHAAAEATRRCGATLLQYPVWLWQWGSPDDVPWDRAVRLDLAPATLERKRRALDCYRSQVDGVSDLPGEGAVLSSSLLRAAGRDFEVFCMDDPDRRVAAEMDAVHHRSLDPWDVATRWYERRKRAVTLASLPKERYQRVLEVGCSVGALTADLATRADHVTAVDVSARSLQIARSRLDDLISQDQVSLELLQVPWTWPAGPRFDCIVLSEVGYFLSVDGWRTLVDRCLASLEPGGTLLACHWREEPVGWPLSGDQIHESLSSDERWQVSVAHREDDFTVHVLTPSSLHALGWGAEPRSGT